MSASEARLLRAVSRALEPFDTDLADIEKRSLAMATAMREHEDADARRFLQAQQEIGSIHHELEFLKNHLDLVHDQMIQGFRDLKVVINKRDPNEVTPPRRSRNGQ